MIPENQGENKALHFMPGFSYVRFQAIYYTTTLSVSDFLNNIYSFILLNKQKELDISWQHKVSGSLGMIRISRNRTYTEFDTPHIPTITMKYNVLSFLRSRDLFLMLLFSFAMTNLKNCSNTQLNLLQVKVSTEC